jgi:hypothetical protein
LLVQDNPESASATRQYIAAPAIFKSGLVGAVGIELKATLKIRNLLILLNGKNAKNTGFAQPRYTPGTRTLRRSRREVLATG